MDPSGLSEQCRITTAEMNLLIACMIIGLEGFALAELSVFSDNSRPTDGDGIISFDESFGSFDVGGSRGYQQSQPSKGYLPDGEISGYLPPDGGSDMFRIIDDDYTGLGPKPDILSLHREHVKTTKIPVAIAVAASPSAGKPNRDEFLKDYTEKLKEIDIFETAFEAVPTKRKKNRIKNNTGRQ